MKKIYLLSLITILLSCSDGDLQIETLNFDDVTAQYCGTLSIDTELFFKINDNEALILTLQSGVLKNEVSTEAIISTVPSQSTLTYRTFSNTVAKDYFCDSLPPVSPTVIGEIEAANGSVLIETVAGANGSFVHTITLSDITLLKSDGSRITDLTISEFAEITTTP
tara:strand:- start:6616 stop:7113 length:498 start_codon:yes stop_codon:yes gene_type:complete